MKHVFLLVFVILLSSCSDRPFRQVGYFKDGLRNRVFTIAYEPGTPEQSIRKHAESLMYTSGQMMAAYFYPEGSKIPADGITLAHSLAAVNEVLYEMKGLGKWRYAFMRYFPGDIEFVDCQETPLNDLCRQD